MFDLEKVLDQKSWKTTRKHTYKVRELWFPFSAAVDKWDHSFHELMLRDRVRMQAFSDAVKAAMHVLALRAENSTGIIRILDIGTGTGVWAYLCWKQLHSKISRERLRIYALEGNRRTFDALTVPCLKNSGITEDTILPCNVASSNFVEFAISNEKSLPNFDNDLFNSFCQNQTMIFDAIICECIGGIGDDEGITEILRDALKKLARKDCIIIPNSLDVIAVPVWEDSTDAGSIHSQIQRARIQHGVIHVVGGQYGIEDLVEEETPIVDVVIPRSAHASDEAKIKDFDFFDAQSLQSEYEVQCCFKIGDVPEKHQITGFKIYFKSKLFYNTHNQPIILNISGDQINGKGKTRTSDCWKHTFLPLNKLINVYKNDKLNFTLLRSRAQSGAVKSANTSCGEKIFQPIITYSWSGVVSGAGSADGVGQYSFRNNILAAPIIERNSPQNVS